MKTLIILIFLLFIYGAYLFAQQELNVPQNGKYLNQKEPEQNTEMFASGLVSVGQGVHGNIVFTHDFSEAAWHPNYKVNGKSLIYIMKFRNGQWENPIEFFPKEGYNYADPFYSYDGKKLYFLSGEIDSSGNAEDEKIFFVERKGDSWTEPQLLSSNLPAFHWQFSLDSVGNLYFGGSSLDKKSEIYFSQFKNGNYETPTRLAETINGESAEFSPFISPDNTYILFTRLVEQKNSPPQMNLFVSFRKQDGNWTFAQNLTDKIGLPAQTPFVMMSAARITPDGKYLFFTFFNGEGHMVYWTSTKIIEDLRLNE